MGRIVHGPHSARWRPPLPYTARPLGSGALHGFTHPGLEPDPVACPGIGCHRPSAERAWRAMLDLFDEVFPTMV
ncbi:hypothetical protein [Streptomyces sp. NEAU-174]|uniref:hypothetical protein n=1 Tax=Streptomyces sp. NEAU-174 TaxID=3458254 RepID=UPI004043C1A4